MTDKEMNQIVESFKSGSKSWTDSLPHYNHGLSWEIDWKGVAVLTRWLTFDYPQDTLTPRMMIDALGKLAMEGNNEN